MKDGGQNGERVTAKVESTELTLDEIDAELARLNQESDKPDLEDKKETIEQKAKSKAIIREDHGHMQSGDVIQLH